MNTTQSHHVLLFEGGTDQAYEQELIGEEPLLIRVEGRPYSVVMRTPGDEIFHVAGFCLGEGLVDEPEDFATVGYCNQLGSNVATVTLQPARRKKVQALLERRGFISQTSCGICGKELIKDLCQVLFPTTDKTKIDITQALECVNQFSLHQDLYKKTASSHAAMIFDSELRFMTVGEDVGRHNALDKAIGKAFMGRHLGKACLAVLSSRISYELVQKAARAHLPILLSISRPTSLAVELGRSLNMTLACISKKNGLLVFCGEERLYRG
nr:sulfurtransferase FdhD [Desulfobacterales bacterium]